ncbi:MAG: phosphoenolpyruvate carboxykinase (ATP), partial [Spirochaetia bacterium]|nr:phosphoenolpyruvate carboxykinase (ATP) [Spirochaetia bacterium]
DHDEYTEDPVMNLSIPNHSKEFSEETLHPWRSWNNGEEYNLQRKKLAEMFIKNFLHCSPGSDFDYSKYGPRI